MFIICCGMYRSASTWQYLVASELIEAAGLGTRIGFLDGTALERSEHYQAKDAKVRVVKVHEYHSVFGELIKSGNAKAIYSYRDIRDVVCSIMWKLNLQFESDSVRNMLESAVNSYYEWTGLSGVLVQRYDSMVVDPRGAVLDIAQYIGVPTDHDRVEEIVKMHSREANRKRSRRLAKTLVLEGKDLSQPENALIWDPQTLLHWNHVRPDGDASWREILGYRELLSLEPLVNHWLTDAGFEPDDMWLQRWLSIAPSRVKEFERDATSAGTDGQIQEQTRSSLPMTTERTDHDAGQFVSYAQNFEDVILWRALQGIDRGFYIDVGAWLPDQDSVTRAFYERGWRGINVEPNSAYHTPLQEKRPEDINLQIGLADEPGLLDLYVVPNTGLSTMDPRITAEHEENGHSIHVETCPVTTLDLVWEKYVEDRDVHFLKVDVEGFEDKVLRGNDWRKHRPWIVVVEATLPNKQVAAFEGWEPILLNAGYQFVYADGLNRFYVAREHEDLSLSFEFPPNFFDQFKTVAQAEAEARAAEVEQALDAEKKERARADALATAAKAEAEARTAEVEQALGAEKKERARADALATAAHAEAEARTAEVEEALSAEVEERARADALVKELEETKQELDQMRHWAVQLKTEVLAIYHSKSWRITAPLRAAAARSRELRAKLRHTTPQVGSPPYSVITPSRSGRIASPFRVAKRMLLRMVNSAAAAFSAVGQRCKGLIKRMLHIAMHVVRGHPRLDSIAVRLVKRFPRLEQRLRALVRPPPPSPPPTAFTVPAPPLTPRAEQIYKDLKHLMDNTKR